MSVTQQAAQAKEASFQLASLSTEVKNKALITMAQALRTRAHEVLEANQLDLQAAQIQVENGSMKKSLYDRLKLTDEKLKTVIQGLEELSNLPDPVGRVLASTELDEGLVLKKISCPIGLIGVIFEARPNAKAK